MVTPILFWSEILRSGDARTFRPVVVLWGILIISALIPTVAYTTSEWLPFIDYSQVLLCQTNQSTGCSLNTTVPASPPYPPICNCTDTCGSVTLKGVAFRKDSNLQALDSSRTSHLVRTDGFVMLYIANMFSLAFVILQCIPALLESRWSPEHVRNKIFLSLAGIPDHDHFERSRARLDFKCRYYIGKCTASLGFLFAVLIFMVSPFVFVSSLVVNEVTIWNWPTESYDAVGQVRLVSLAFNE